MDDRKKVDALADAQAKLRAAIPRAADALVECLGSIDSRVRLRAAEAILNRAGLAPAQSPSVAAAQIHVGGLVPEHLQER